MSANPTRTSKQSILRCFEGKYGLTILWQYLELIHNKENACQSTRLRHCWFLKVKLQWDRLEPIISNMPVFALGEQDKWLSGVTHIFYIDGGWWGRRESIDSTFSSWTKLSAPECTHPDVWTPFWLPNTAELQGLFPPVVLWHIHFIMDELLTSCTHLLYFTTEQMYASNFCG
jgi:hypothetical protein